MESFRLYLESEGIYNLVKSLESMYPGLSMYASENNYRIHLHQIKAKPEGQGIGTKAIQALQKYAKSIGKPIILSPYPDRGKKAKLLNFYKNMGFYPNTGRKRDYTISLMTAPTWVWRPNENT